MVDFNNEATVTTPSWDLLKILALEKRENLMLSIEFFYKNKYQDADLDHELNIIRTRIWCLYFELEAWINRSYPKPELEVIKALIEDKDYKEVLKVVTFLNKFMDEKNLIKVDTKQVYNKQRTEIENEIHQL
jgi:hypothetical protein